MQPGDIIADRFEIGKLVGSGAMGVVFRGRDHATGAEVAVKVLRNEEDRDEARFEREAEVLADLHHPHIVRYVAHGATPLEDAYLVMEWIEGEDLGRRLSRGRLPVDACVALGARVASALALAHARGVIHRDVKPSNLFLPRSNVSEVKVLDFGIARLSSVPRATQTGTVLGTPGYLPPEQARGEDVLDPRADMFSLGCVLFECLTGAPAFAGQHLPAILAKILFEPAPSARALCPETPEALDGLIARMLSKNPADRPTSAAAAALLDSLDHLAAAEIGGEAPPSIRPPALTSDEQRVLSVVIVGTPWVRIAADPVGDDVLDLLRRVATARGARLERMADGSMAAIPLEALPPLDEAAQAARLALALHAAVRDRPVVMASARSGGLFKRTIGDAINRAVRLLDASKSAALGAGAARPDPHPHPTEPGAGHHPGVLIDEISARLLEKRFDLHPAPPGFTVLRERVPDVMDPEVLGRAMPYVGRKAELRMLATLFTESVAESVTHAALVTAPSGFGKSRLAQEFLHAARREAPTLTVWSAQGDVLRAGAVFGLLGQALRGAAGLVGGEPVELCRERLRTYVAARVPPSTRVRVTEFIGELVGVPYPDEGSPALWAARTDLRLMREQMLRAWGDLLRAECSRGPVVLVLDDLQWGDSPTLRSIGSALGTLKDLPFFVLGLARPEVSQVFPKLWEEQGVCNVRLKELTRKAGTELVERTLGAQATPALIDRLVTQADGHALYLEELIRAVAQGHEETAPETVLALVDARLSTLPAEARRVLRAASVFGEVAWASGVAALVADAGPEEVLRHLEVLVKHDVLVRRADTRFTGEVEYGFRHTLLRDGAYAMLTDADRTLGHRLAGDWLEAHGEADPLLLAEHFGRGGSSERAGRAFVRAAEQSYRAGDSDGAIRHARRGLALDLPLDLRGALLAVLCEACMWRFEWDAAASIIAEVGDVVRPGSVPWVHVTTARFWLSTVRGAFDAVPVELAVIQATAIDPEAVPLVALSLGVGVFILDMLCRFDAARTTLAGLDAVVDPVAARDWVARGWRDVARAHFVTIAERDPWRGLGLGRAAAASFQDAGHSRGLPIAMLAVGICLWHLGAFEEAERTLRGSMVDWALGDFALLRDHYLTRTLLDRGALDAAEEAATALVARSRAIGVLRYEGRGHWLLAETHARSGDLDAAEREALLALEQLPDALLHRLPAMVTIAAIRLRQGRPEEALRLAEDACRAADLRGTSKLRACLVQAEALEAAGARARARAVIADAHATLLADADKIGAPGLRRSFLERIPEHARIAQLLATWRAEDEGRPPGPPTAETLRS